jgi:hypothetical protein
MLHANGPDLHKNVQLAKNTKIQKTQIQKQRNTKMANKQIKMIKRKRLGGHK